MATIAKTPNEETITVLNDISVSEKLDAEEKVARGLNQRKENSEIIPVAESFIELRGVLEGTTDEKGRTGTEMLRDARKYDRQRDRKPTHEASSNSDE